jgi:hypothetical protein
MDELVTPFGLALMQSKDHFVKNLLYYYLHDMKTLFRRGLDTFAL